VGKTDYARVIDPLGRRLTLTPLAKPLPPATLLRPAFPAPDLSFVDQTGKSRRLSQYRDKAVLLDFWGNHCSPCRRALPTLLDAYAKLHPAGVEIIGIDSSGSVQGVRVPPLCRRIRRSMR
jgi:thiol-disulfide isomerase/thioredoxin